jgi:hypothetical protein
LIPAHFLDTRAGLAYLSLQTAAHDPALHSRNIPLAANAGGQRHTQMFGVARA